MFTVTDIVLTLHLCLLIGFIGVTSLLMLVTVTNRLRIRRVVLAWRAGCLFGLPLWPSLFMTTVFVLLGISVLLKQPINVTLFAGYLSGGLFWFVSAVFSTTVIVTEYGLISNVNYAERAISWGQIVDYFQYTRKKQKGYVFFYVDSKGVRRRMELQVPAAYHRSFKAFVGVKVDSRLEMTDQQVYGKETMEG